MDVFCVRGPNGLWFSRRDSSAGINVWSADIGLACKFGTAEAAMEQAAALCAESGGDAHLVYGVSLERRRLGRVF